MRHLMNTFALVAGLAALPTIGCGLSGADVTADELIAALPTAEMLLIPYPGASEVAARVTSDSLASVTASCESADSEESARFYQQGCAVIARLNGTVNDVLDLIERVTSNPPSYEGDNAYAWGPYTDDAGVTRVFKMRKNEDGSVSYRLEALPAAEGSEVLVVLRGEIEEGVSLEENVGMFQINYDAMQQVDPSRSLAGLGTYDYDRLGTQTGVAANLEGVLGSDGATHNIRADYDLNDDRSGALRYGYTDDLVVVEESALQEVQKVNTRWLSTGAGRSDATVSGGDLGSNVGYISECWATDYLAVYTNASWWEASEGDEALCVFEEADYL